jgi:hypothetical protein
MVAKAWNLDRNTGGLIPLPDPLLQSLWFVDPIRGDDNNSGATKTDALKTLTQIVVRWGSRSPYLANPTTIYILGDIPTTDGWAGMCPVFGPGASLVFQGQLGIPLATVTIGTYTLPNFTAGTLNTITAQGETGAFWSQYVGCYAYDVTQKAYFMIGADAGNATAQISQPRSSPDSFPGTLVPLADGDIVKIYNLSTLPVSDTNSSGAGEVLSETLTFRQLNLVAINSVIQLNAAVAIAESTIGSLVGGSLDGDYVSLFGVYMVSQFSSAYTPWNGSANFYGGWIVGAGTVFSGFVSLDGDIVIPLRIHWLGGASINIFRAYFGQTMDIDSSPKAYFNITGVSNYGDGFVWGPGGWDASNNALVNSSGLPFTEVCLLKGELLISTPSGVGSSNTGWYFNTATGVFASEAMTTAGVDLRGGYCNPLTNDGIYNQG